MSTYKRYKVIDKVCHPHYSQWINLFTQKVLRRGKIEGNVVEIYDIQEYKRIFIKVDGKEYVIRTWDYVPTFVDERNLICGADVSYMLSEDRLSYVPMSDGGHFGFHDPIVSGSLPILWSNSYIPDSQPFLTFYEE